MLPLEGIKVIDLTLAEFGPRASMLLADMGADVIKVEPRQGEPLRGVTRNYDRGDISSYFLSHNRNKRGIALDITKQKGKDILYKLIEISDVFITTYRPKAMQRHGFSYEEVRQRNPKIIYGCGNGFGLKGPLCEKGAFDIMMQGYSGLTYQTGIDGSPATPAGTAVIDQCSGAMLAFGIMVALYVRERTGIGQMVDGSLLGTALYLLSIEVVSHLFSGKHLPKSGRGLSYVKALAYNFPTSDGWIVLGGLPNEAWPEFCRVMEIIEITNDPRFATVNEREDHRAELIPILEEKFRTRPSREWIEKLDKVGVFVGPVNSLSEVLSDQEAVEQMRTNGYLCDIELPQGEKVTVVGPPVKLSETPPEVRRGYFSIGEHNYEVLTELGYSPEEIAELIVEEVI
jgi:crotonobetainyl-CoA:carnitine CoA-transferase CaiB-like acyl-CoA transferase